MSLIVPRPSRWQDCGRHSTAILHRLSPSQSMQVRAVKVSLTAGERARIAISTSWAMPTEMAWLRGGGGRGRPGGRHGMAPGEEGPGRGVEPEDRVMLGGDPYQRRVPDEPQVTAG